MPEFYQALCLGAKKLMMEAVNSVLQTAPLIRANAEQVGASESFASNPGRVQKAAQAPFISPYIVVDVNFNKAVLQIRDSDTGDVLNQFPSEKILQSRARAQKADLARQTEVSQQPVSSAEDTGTDGEVPAVDLAPQELSAATAQQLAAFNAASQASQATGGDLTVFA